MFLFRLLQAKEAECNWLDPDLTGVYSLAVALTDST